MLFNWWLEKVDGKLTASFSLIRANCRLAHSLDCALDTSPGSTPAANASCIAASSAKMPDADFNSKAARW